MASTLSGNDFASCFPPLNSYCSTSASKLGLPNSGVPIILQHENAVTASRSKSVNHKDKSSSVTIPNNEHLEFQEGDTPTVKQIKSLTKEVSSLRNELKAKDQLIESLQVKDSVPMAGQNSALPWKDKVSSPEVHSRMKLQYFPPAVEGETVRVSPPKHVETHGAEKWKDYIVEVSVHSELPHSIDLLTSAGRLVKVGVKYPWRPLRCVACNVFGHSECNQLARGSVQPEILMKNTPKEPAATIPCANQFSALQEGGIIGTEMELSGKGVIPAPNVHKSVVTLDASDPLIVSCVALVGKGNTVESMNPIVNLVDSCDDQGALPAYDFLPHDLGVGISDPDAVFQALTEMAQASSKQAKGSVARIIVAWRKQGTVVSELFKSEQMILLSVEVDMKSFLLSVVYGSNHVPSRRQLWDDLRICKGFVGSLPWITVGDFNSLRKPYEKSDPCHFDSSAASEFNNCLEDIEDDKIPQDPNLSSEVFATRGLS
ncbi:hypothetical protein RHGRI_029259 [Rhododendron griersonianum]|uniref:Uncharacterized protein n=1 Tax=Rhododendron griersonianum TaxID=479676 RepID=A0AAV6INB4_9ERIC|nr:hypothetical protein RHGRI_029259 [Rhododendron griersonianum]